MSALDPSANGGPRSNLDPSALASPKRRLGNPLVQFRIVAIAEGISYVVLVFLAMPLKYWAHIPGPVRIVGGLHGFLFILFCVTLLRAGLAQRWPLSRWALAFVSSLVPLGTFLFDRALKAELAKP